MADPKKGDTSLAGATEKTKPTYSYYGWRSTNKGTKRDATMDDYPAISARKEETASQLFETTALAVDGAQKGAFYGSVRWGFSKESGQTDTKLVDFHPGQKAAPSAGFSAAAASWNPSSNTAGEASIPLPLSKDNFVKVLSTLLDNPRKGKTLARLAVNTAVETLDDSSEKGWVKVVVTSGSETGNAGWIKASQLSATQVMKKK